MYGWLKRKRLRDILYFLKKKILEDFSPLIHLFRLLVIYAPGFQGPGVDGFLTCVLPRLHAMDSQTKTADLLMASMAAKPFLSAYLYINTSIGGTWTQDRVWQSSKCLSHAGPARDISLVALKPSRKDLSPGLPLQENLRTIWISEQSILSCQCDDFVLPTKKPEFFHKDDCRSKWVMILFYLYYCFCNASPKPWDGFCA